MCELMSSASVCKLTPSPVSTFVVTVNTYAQNVGSDAVGELT